MTVPKFKNREEYERWKAERLANPQPSAPLQPPQRDSGSVDDDPTLADPLKQIKQAWIAGVISGIVTLVVTIIAASGNDVLGLGFSAYNYLDVVLIFGLSIGIYYKSRTCSLMMLLYFVGSKIFIWLELGKPSGMVGALLFGYYFLMGTFGTFACRSIKAGQGSSSAWRPLTINAAVVSLIVVLFFGRSIGLNFDAASLIPGATIEWKEFSSPEGTFSILMPGQPAQSNQTVKTAAGDMELHQYMVELRSGAYGVIYSDLPPLFLQQPDAARRLLDGGRDGAVSQVKGKLVSEDIIHIGLNPGRELHVEFAKGTIRTRMYLINARLYQVVAVIPSGHEQKASEDTTKFLDSFRTTL
jgi:hypothetical protein